jgi:hypothetical protein
VHATLDNFNLPSRHTHLGGLVDCRKHDRRDLEASDQTQPDRQQRQTCSDIVLGLHSCDFQQRSYVDQRDVEDEEDSRDVVLLRVSLGP